MLPYRNIKSVYVAYKLGFQSDVSLRHQINLLSYWQFGKLCNYYKYSIGLNIWIQRNTTNLMSCSVCDAYDAWIRIPKTDKQQNILKTFKSRNTTKQQKQRLKYYKHCRNAMHMKNPKRYLSTLIDGIDHEKKNKLLSDEMKLQG